MADITVTAAQVGVVFPDEAEIYTAIAGTTITAGAAVFFNTTTGRLALADGSGAGTAIVHGIALNGAGAGQAVSLLKRGHVYGYTLAGDYNSLAYLSDTNTGILGDAAGTVSVVVGRVVPLADSAATKVLYVNAPSW
jgi:hypothetical protein